ncbi:phospholipid carrier-dependent glycosyltransferase [bacterium]|nr:MAG: phospholipid carrier-dependent glycosyltransferase [bacterium]
MQEKARRTNQEGDEKNGFFRRLTAVSQRFAVPFLWMLILLGIACRFYGVNWDEGTTLHPDERFCVSLIPGLKLPNSAQQFFDSRVSPVNPANLTGAPHYVYGQLPLFIGAIVGHFTLERVEGGPFLGVGRMLAAFFDCGTILMTLLIARRLFSPRWALLAAALVAGAALHIQQSHFFVVDTFAAFFLTASFWAGVRLVQHQKWPDALLCGLFFGAALASKISTVLLGAALLGFLVLLARRTSWKNTLPCAVLCMVATIVVFRVGHPMAFRGEFGFFDFRPEPRFVIDINQQAAITKGIVDVPFNVQWIGRTPLLFSLRNLGFWGYGWPFLLSAGAGVLILSRRRHGNGVLLVGAFFGIVLLAVQGTAFSKFTRYFLPLTPMCALLATYFWREVSSKRQVWRWGAAATVLSVGLWGLSVGLIYGRQHTRIAASNWIAQNLQPGTFVANETDWDEGLPISWYQNLPPVSLNTVVLGSYNVDTEIKREELAQSLDRVEWIFLSSGRSWQNIPRWPQKWPMMSNFYRALFEGRMGFTLEKKFTSFPRLGPFEFPDANVEEALTVYDHPMVLIFHKTPDYNGEQVRNILEMSELTKAQNWEPRLAPKPDESKLPMPPGF